MEPIHFFRAGTHKPAGGASITFSDSDLTAIADAYSPRLHEAPIVVGHPRTDAPAYGWIESIVAKPDGLYAVPKQVNNEFADMVAQGAYKKVSAAFFMPNTPNNPTPGVPYLRHIGFLGAVPPAVKGLKPIEFSDDAGLLFMEEDVLDLREHRLNVRERLIAQSSFDTEIRKAQSEGRFPKEVLPEVFAFCDSLGEEEFIAFADQDGTATTRPQRKWFLDFLKRLPLPVVTGEIATGEFADAGEEDFLTPDGYTVDQKASAIHRRALAHMRSHGGAYVDAVRAIKDKIPRE